VKEGKTMKNKQEGKDQIRLTRKQALKALVGKKGELLKLFNDSVIYIVEAQNGTLLVTMEGAQVFLFDDQNIAGLQELHYSIDEALGHWGSSHDRQRMHHIIEHGSSYTCEEKDCAVCRDEALRTRKVVE
jgi:hypothetical protein